MGRLEKIIPGQTALTFAQAKQAQEKGAAKAKPLAKARAEGKPKAKADTRASAAKANRQTAKAKAKAKADPTRGPREAADAESESDLGDDDDDTSSSAPRGRLHEEEEKDTNERVPLADGADAATDSSAANCQLPPAPRAATCSETVVPEKRYGAPDVVPPIAKRSRLLKKKSVVEDDGDFYPEDTGLPRAADGTGDPTDSASYTPPRHPRPQFLNPDKPHEIPDYILQTLLDRLEPADVEILIWFLTKKSKQYQEVGYKGIPVGTGCSGSDSFIQMLEALCRRCPSIAIDPRLSVESSPKVREYLKVAFPEHDNLFPNVRDLGLSFAINARSEALSKAAIEAVFAWAAGFVCKDVSLLNNESTSSRECVRDGTGRTGMTWGGCMNYEKSHPPDCSFYENVCNLASKKDPNSESNLDCCHEQLAKLGKASLSVKANPTEFLIPENRLRLYIVASRRMSLEQLEQIPVLVESMKAREGEDIFPIDMFLLPKGHRLIKKALEEELEAKRECNTVKGPRKTEKKKPWKKKSSNQEEDLNFYADPFQASQCPWLDTITEREVDILKTVPFTRVADLSQGKERVPAPKKEVAPCIAPNATLWVRMKPEKDSRVIIGIEKCALQGIFMEPHVAEQFSNRFKDELAGNGFCSPVLLAISIAMFVAMGRKEKIEHDEAEAEQAANEMEDIIRGCVRTRVVLCTCPCSAGTLRL